MTEEVFVMFVLCKIDLQNDMMIPFSGFVINH